MQKIRNVLQVNFWEKTLPDLLTYLPSVIGKFSEDRGSISVNFWGAVLNIGWHLIQSEHELMWCLWEGDTYLTLDFLKDLIYSLREAKSVIQNLKKLEEKLLYMIQDVLLATNDVTLIKFLFSCRCFLWGSRVLVGIAILQ